MIFKTKQQIHFTNICIRFHLQINNNLKFANQFSTGNYKFSNTEATNPMITTPKRRKFTNAHGKFRYTTELTSPLSEVEICR